MGLMLPPELLGFFVGQFEQVLYQRSNPRHFETRRPGASHAAPGCEGDPAAMNPLLEATAPWRLISLLCLGNPEQDSEIPQLARSPCPQSDKA